MSEKASSTPHEDLNIALEAIQSSFQDATSHIGDNLKHSGETISNAIDAKLGENVNIKDRPCTNQNAKHPSYLTSANINQKFIQNAKISCKSLDAFR